MVLSIAEKIQRTKIKDIEDFSLGFKENAQLDFPQDDETHKFRLDSVCKFIATLFLNQRNHSTSNFFIRKCLSGEYMCNVFIPARITDIEPVYGVILSTCTTRAYLTGISKSFYSKNGSAGL